MTLPPAFPPAPAPDDAPAPGSAPGPAPAQAPREGVRGLLLIALGWTVAMTALVAAIPPQPQVAEGGGSAAGFDTGTLDGDTFTITSIGGQQADASGDATYTVAKNPVVIAVELHQAARVECWNYDLEQGDDASGSNGTWTLEVPIHLGDNYIECYRDTELGQWTAFTVDMDPSAKPSPGSSPSASRRPLPSVQPGFALQAINGDPVTWSGGKPARLTVADELVDLDLAIRGVTTVACENFDTGEEHSVGGMPGDWTVRFYLDPGLNRIRCRLPGDAASAVDLVLDYRTADQPTPEPSSEGSIILEYAS